MGSSDLVFTTHWFLDMTQVVAQTSSTPNPRQAVFEYLPSTQDVETINSLLKDFTEETLTVKKTANSLTVTQYLGPVGRLFSVTADNMIQQNDL